jgi:hypothetical protein
MLHKRAPARTHLHRIGELHLHAAVSALQARFVKHGLVRQIGQDALQWIVSEAFRPVWAPEVPE